MNVQLTYSTQVHDKVSIPVIVVGYATIVAVIFRRIDIADVKEAAHLYRIIGLLDDRARDILVGRCDRSIIGSVPGDDRFWISFGAAGERRGITFIAMDTALTVTGNVGPIWYIT